MVLDLSIPDICAFSYLKYHDHTPINFTCASADTAAGSVSLVVAKHL